MGVLIVHLWSLGKCWLFHRGSMQSSWRKFYVSESEGAQPLFCALSFAFAFSSAFLFLFTLVFLHAFPFYGTLWVAMLCSSGFKFLFLSFITLAYQLSFTFWFFRDVRIKNGKPKFLIWKFIFARAMNDDIIGQTQCHRWLSYHGCTLQADSPLNHARQPGKEQKDPAGSSLVRKPRACTSTRTCSQATMNVAVHEVVLFLRDLLRRNKTTNTILLYLQSVPQCKV